MNPEELVDLYRAIDDPEPLRGLRDVDWAAVNGAYGPATDVPSYLRALLSENPDHRYIAVELLYQTLWHQGTIYSASATAVPFLYNLLEADGPHDKGAVAELIAAIADGDPSFSRCEGDPEEFARWEAILAKSGRSLRDEIAAGRVVAEEVRQQVALRFDLLRAHLRFEADPAFMSPEAAKALGSEILERLAGRLAGHNAAAPGIPAQTKA